MLAYQLDAGAAAPGAHLPPVHDSPPQQSLAEVQSPPELMHATHLPLAVLQIPLQHSLPEPQGISQLYLSSHVQPLQAPPRQDRPPQQSSPDAQAPP